MEVSEFPQEVVYNGRRAGCASKCTNYNALIFFHHVKYCSENITANTTESIVLRRHSEPFWNKCIVTNRMVHCVNVRKIHLNYVKQTIWYEIITYSASIIMRGGGGMEMANNVPPRLNLSDLHVLNISFPSLWPLVSHPSASIYLGCQSTLLEGYMST